MITKRWLPFLGKNPAEAMRKQRFLLFVASMVALLASEGSAVAQCFNTATGQGALHYNEGCYNTGDGFGALQGNPNGGNTGGANSAVGFYALVSNSTGGNNTAVGDGALSSNSGGSSNVAVGFNTGPNSNGDGNTFIGVNSGQNNSSGHGNIFLGVNSGYYNTTGSSNIMIGSDGQCLGYNWQSNTIRIGCPGSGDGRHNTTYIAGIFGSSAGGGVPVYVNSNGQLGTTLSSARFKEQIEDMGDRGNKLFQLRPVTFYYKAEYDDGSHQLQYGLIAEEVAKIYPELVSYDKDGKPYTVKYQYLAPMLLSALQSEHAQLEAHQSESAFLRSQLEELQAQGKLQKTRSDAQEAQFEQLTSELKGMRAALKISGGPSAELVALSTKESMLRQ